MIYSVTSLGKLKFNGVAGSTSGVGSTQKLNNIKIAKFKIFFILQPKNNKQNKHAHTETHVFQRKKYFIKNKYQ